MFKLIRTHQKKFLAVTGVLLMITFVGSYGSTPRGGRETPADREVGRANGKKVMLSEVATAHQELLAVQKYTRKVGMQFGGSLLGNRLGPDVAANLVQNPELFVLLRREAVAGGTTADPSEVQSWMDNYLGGSPDGEPVDVPSADSDEYQLIRAGVSDTMLITNYFSRVTSAIKLSTPAVDRAMATMGQSIQLTLVPVPTDAFEKDVPAPTAQQLADQFKRFADTVPGRPDAGNPFGFGYRVPMLVKLQYLRLTRDAVEQAVVATQSDYDWEVAARKLYHANPEQFATPAPTTRPTDAAGPAITPPFEKVKLEALHTLRDPQVQSLQDRVQQHINGALTRDFAAFQQSAKDGKPAPSTPVGKAYNDPAYLQALADQVDHQFHVKLSPQQTDDLSAEQLQKLEHLGSAQATVSSGAPGDGSLPGYVSDRALGYLAAADPKPATAVAEMMRPSSPFTEEAGSAVDFLRLLSVKPAHAAVDLASVEATAKKDLTAAAAYELAKAQADKLVTAAGAGNLPFVAAAAGLERVASQPLTMNDMTVDHLQPPLGDSAHEFMTQAFGLLDSYDPAKNAHPVKVIPLPAQKRLIVVQLTLVNVRWTTADYAAMRLQASASLRQQYTTLLRYGWFTPQAIEERTGYQSQNKNQEQGS